MTTGPFRRRFCTAACRKAAHHERQKAEAEPDEPEPLEALLQTPMPVVEEVEAAPPPVHSRVERGDKGSAIANKEPIHDEHRARQARLHDRDADRRFVEALAPALSSEAVERARDVRLRVGDPAAQLLG